MNLVDIVLLLIVIFSIFSGYRKGFIYGLFSIVSWVASLLITLYCYRYVVNWIDGNGGYKSVWTVPVAFFITFIVVKIVVGAIIGWVLGAIPRETHENILNRALGVLPGLLNGLIIAALIATFLLIVPITEPITEKAQNSWIAQRLSEPVAEVEDRLSPIIGETIQKTIGKLTIDPESQQFIKLPYTVETPKPRPDLEVKMLALLNEERAKRGLKVLKADPEMQIVARDHSKDMFVRGYFSHYTPEKKDPFDRMRARNVQFVTAGENLALARTVLMAHEGLMNSPGHRANILQPSFGRVGIGIMDGGIYGIMVTQDFRN
jgi:uncharacterized protein YkwD